MESKFQYQIIERTYSFLKILFKTWNQYATEI